MVTVVNKGKYWYGYAEVMTTNFAQETAAATTFEYTIGAVPWKCKVKKCTVVFDATVTGQDTNYATLSIVNKKGDGSGTTALASKAFTAGVNGTAFIETSLGAVANNTLFPGDVLTFKKAVTVLGQQLQAGIAKVELIRVE
jgi:hypothetical protein